MKYKLNELQRHNLKTIEIENQVVPKRPDNNQSFFSRVKEAWAVICGKLDTVEWAKGQ